MENPSKEALKARGTLAIDLGNSTTVVAYQGELDKNPEMIELPLICRKPGEVPSLVYFNPEAQEPVLIGQQVIDLRENNNSNLPILSDFKRWIGVPNSRSMPTMEISPEKAGELLIKKVWSMLPGELNIRRLVLTAPVETYRSYRAWLNKVCSSLPIDEIALVDEPTAAAMGAGLPPGSKLLVIDIGGSTIDLSLVALEGGEGKADPVAQLIRFDGQNLEGKSKQVFRSANVIAKAGLRLGGRDLDRWIVNHLFPEKPITEFLLNKAEHLKCLLSQDNLKGTQVIEEFLNGQTDDYEENTLKLCRNELEQLLIERGFIDSLKKLLDQTITNASKNGCNIEDLHGVVLVGGVTRIPIIKRWVEKEVQPIPLLTPPPIEAVARGALKLTPGVSVKDILQRGVSLRYWEKKSQKHLWHPLFLAGQPWPTARPLEIILSASQEKQLAIELVLGEPEIQDANEIIYVNGVPHISKGSAEPLINTWAGEVLSIPLDPVGKLGDDCLKLLFSVDTNCHLIFEGIDLRTGERFQQKSLGSVR